MTVILLGSTGFVGRALRRALVPDFNLIAPSHGELDLMDQSAIHDYFLQNPADIVINAAGKVGGIAANQAGRPEYLFANTMIQLNTLHAAHQSRIRKYINLGSSCIYPKDTKQPIKEDQLLTSPLEPTNEGYALAKIVGLKYGQYLKEKYDFACTTLMPSNIYGDEGFDDIESAHVIPALVHRIGVAKKQNHKSVTVWGTGEPLREFLHVDDFAQAVITVITTQKELPYFFNVGSDHEISIGDLARLLATKLGYHGNIEFDTSKPSGTPRKALDSSFIKSLGWAPSKSFDEHLDATIAFYKEQWSL